MRTSTRVLIMINVIAFVGAILLFPAILSVVSFHPVFTFAFSNAAIAALIFCLIWFITAIILFVRTIKRLTLTKKLFFITLASTSMFAIMVFALLNVNTMNFAPAIAIGQMTNIGNNFTVIYLFVGLLILFYLIFLAVSFKLMTRPVKKIKLMVEDINNGYHNGKYKVGGGRDFVEIVQGLKGINKIIQEKENQIKIANAEYEKNIPKQFLKFLGKRNYNELELGNNITKEVTTMFCDIKNLTEKSQTLSLTDNFKCINSYLNLISSIIRKYNGFIDKYLGDGVLAVFYNSNDAVECSKEIIKSARIKNKTDKTPYEVDISIGIHTGEVVFGVVGEKERKLPTIISDNVNYAFKMQEVNKIYGTTVLVSKRTLNTLRNDHLYNFRYVGLLKLNNKTETRFAIFELLDVLPMEKKSNIQSVKNIFEEGVRLFDDQKFKEASVCFKKTLIEEETDKASIVYLDRCDEQLTPPDKAKSYKKKSHKY